MLMHKINPGLSFIVVEGVRLRGCRCTWGTRGGRASELLVDLIRLDNDSTVLPHLVALTSTVYRTIRREEISAEISHKPATHETRMHTSFLASMANLSSSNCQS